MWRRHHKLKVLTGAWWNKDNRPPPEHLFYSYKRIPKECRRLLERWGSLAAPPPPPPCTP